MSIFSPICIPKSFFARLFTIQWNRSSSSIQCSCLELPQLRCRTLHLVWLNLMRFPWTRPLSLARSLWMASRHPVLPGMSAAPFNFLLFADLLRMKKWGCTHSYCMSLKKTLNGIDPSVDPSDTACHWSPFGHLISIKSFSNTFIIWSRHAPYDSSLINLWTCNSLPSTFFKCFVIVEVLTLDKLILTKKKSQPFLLWGL